MKRLLAHILLFFLYPIGLLPVRCLHALSYVFLYWPLRLTAYRKSVVYINLARSFPEKKYGELRRIARDFYLFLSRIFPETLWLFAASNKKIDRRCTFDNLSELEPLFDRSLIIVMAHYGNWEFLKKFSGPEIQSFSAPCKNNVAVVYKAPRQGFAREVSYLMRRHDPMVLLESQQVPAFMFKHRKERWIYCFIADQSPLPGARYCTRFLNQPTPMITGPESLARTFGCSVAYLAFYETAPARYRCRFTPICANAKETPEHYVTEKFARLLEQDIVNRPACWLWSHRRWKRGPETLRGSDFCMRHQQ